MGKIKIEGVEIEVVKDSPPASKTDPVWYWVFFVCGLMFFLMWVKQNW